MRLTARLLSAPGSLLLGGLAFWVMAWALDAWTHVQVFGVAQGAHVHGGDAIIRVNLWVTGLPFVAAGMAQLMGTDTLLKRGGMPLYLASLFLMLDGEAHAFAFNDHLGEPASAAFFAFVAPAQILVGVMLPFSGRAFDRWYLLGTLALIGLYAASRVVAFAPLRWPENVEALDIFSKAMEFLFIAAVLTLMSAERANLKQAKEAAPAESAAARGTADP